MVALRRLKVASVPALKQLPQQLRDELAQEGFIPLLMRHPMFRLYDMVTPDAIRQLCRKAIEETCLCAHEECWVGRGEKPANMKKIGKAVLVHKMVFVSYGALEYHFDRDLVDDPTMAGESIRVRIGDWACEAALWMEHVTLEGALVAAAGGCDVMVVDADLFRNIAKDHKESFSRLARYGHNFVRCFHDANMHKVTKSDGTSFELFYSSTSEDTELFTQSLSDSNNNHLFNSHELIMDLTRASFDVEEITNKQSPLEMLLNFRASQHPDWRQSTTSTVCSSPHEAGQNGLLHWRSQSSGVKVKWPSFGTKNFADRQTVFEKGVRVQSPAQSEPGDAAVVEQAASEGR